MIASSAVYQLKSRFRGELIGPGDQQYDAARTVFNVTINRRPALIARCAGADDVMQAVNFARKENLLLSVRGTGHNVAGFAVCDDGLVIDLARMKGITVDPQARTVRAEGGCNWGEVNDALQPYGLAATGGFVSVTGVSVSLSAAASAGLCANTASRLTTCSPPKWCLPMAASSRPTGGRSPQATARSPLLGLGKGHQKPCPCRESGCSLSRAALGGQGETMGLLTPDMKRVVEEQRLGFVATVCPDGTPNLSPKGTTAVWDDDHLIFANIRSPGTLANLRQNANVEVNVVDPFVRKGYRFKGVASILESGPLYDKALAFYKERGLQSAIREIVMIRVQTAQPIDSPAYDLGLTEDQVRDRWDRYFQSLRDRKTT
jgi:predicted pyridoxine 5'-phosphate oxidase superfamily flavin-nucleotide-binding protein